MSDNITNLAIISDHAGYALKTVLLAALREKGLDVIDLGTDGPARVDYPDFAGKLAAAIEHGTATHGIAICGSGNGMAIALNRSPKVRAALAYDVTSTRYARLHNDANVLCLGERFIGPQVAQDCVEVFMNTDFEGGRHSARVAKLGQITDGV